MPRFPVAVSGKIRCSIDTVVDVLLTRFSSQFSKLDQFPLRVIEYGESIE